MKLPVVFVFTLGIMLGAMPSYPQTTPAEEPDVEGEAASGEVAADLEAGEKIYKRTCKNCHGPKAKGMASFPPINGLDADHIVAMLELYASGETVGGASGIMKPVAEKLSEDDKANVAAYVATTFPAE